MVTEISRILDGNTYLNFVLVVDDTFANGVEGYLDRVCDGLKCVADAVEDVVDGLVELVEVDDVGLDVKFDVSFGVDVVSNVVEDVGEYVDLVMMLQLVAGFVVPVEFVDSVDFDFVNYYLDQGYIGTKQTNKI